MPNSSFRSVLVSVALGALFWLAVFFVASLVTAQEVIHDADVWCIQHHPCDWAAHTAITVGGTALVDAITPLNAKEARWLFVAFYVQKEVRQMVKFRGYFTGNKDASKIAPLPLWLDGTLDLAAVALGVWLVPKLSSGDRMVVSLGPRALAVSIRTN